MSPPLPSEFNPQVLPGIAAGGICILAGCILGVFTELSAIRDHKLRHRIVDQVVPVEASALNPTHDGQPVYLVGTTSNEGRMEDPEFQTRFQAIHVRRIVERYQWKEFLTSEGGHQYLAQWFPERVDSTRFVEPEDHRNPESPIPHGPWTETTREVTLGSYQLSPDLIRQLDGFERELPASTVPLPGWHRVGETLIRSHTPTDPAIGDIRVIFEQVPNGVVTALARQEGGKLLPLRGVPDSYREIRHGTYSLRDMLPPIPPSGKTTTTWMRLAALLLTVCGLFLAYRATGNVLNRWVARPPLTLTGLGILLQALPASLIWMRRLPEFSLALLIGTLLLAGALLLPALMRKSRQA